MFPLKLALAILTFYLIDNIAAQVSENLLTRTYQSSPKLLHHPPSPIFTGKPYFLELYVDIPEDSLVSVTIFFKTDQSVDYQEVTLEKHRGIYRFQYDPLEFVGDELSYFFVVSTKTFELYATPLNDKGRIAPVRLNPIDPVKYYQSRKK